MRDISEIIEYLRGYDGEPVTLMEVCGTHTASISENGIPDLLSDRIKLVSGPGCPVCVSVAAYIDRLVELSHEENTCVVTFGDMIRVRGSRYSLREAGAQGGKVQMVYSPLDMLKLAKDNPDTQYVFAAVGFETTTPVYAILIGEALKQDIRNVKLLTALKTMPAAIETVYSMGKCIDGFIAPGHVSVITGSDMFIPLAKKLGIPFAVAGFSGEELLGAICALVRSRGQGNVMNLYTSAVTQSGNTEAQRLVAEYFTPCTAYWRGIGGIVGSGMILKPEFGSFDAGSEQLAEDVAMNTGCSCGEVVAGIKSPTQCPLFGKVCTPSEPQGACMVSNEGACYHYYTNNRN